MFITNIDYKKDTWIIKTEDGGRYLIACSVAEKYSLSVSDELSGDVLAENKAFAVRYGKEKALAYIAAAARTESETAKYLKSKHIQPDAAEAVIEFLTENKFLNDANYSDLYALSRSEDGQSRRKIVQKLKKKGIDDAAVSSAEESIDDETELKNARKLLEKHNRLKREIPPVLRRSYLLNKGYAMGFESSVVSLITEELLSEDSGGSYEEYYTKLIDRKIAVLHNKKNDYETAKRKLYSEFLGKGAEMRLIAERLDAFYTDKNTD